MGELRDSPPVAYQEIGGVRKPVSSRYVLSGHRGYGFAVGSYERGRELIIDPSLAYSTFLGGSSHEFGSGIQVDASGNAYVTGFTQSPNFPTTAGAFDRTGSASNNMDAFVSKLNAGGHRARLLHVPRRVELRVGARHRGRHGGQRVRDRQDDVPELPDHRAARSTGPSTSTTARAAASTRSTPSSPS